MATNVTIWTCRRCKSLLINEALFQRPITLPLEYFIETAGPNPA